MAREAKYTHQHAVVATKNSFDLVVAVSTKAKCDKAPVVRAALDLLFDLDDGELKPGDTFEAAVDRAIARMAEQGVTVRLAPEAAV